jgi:membrane-bound lytic murein transglycosylase D
MKIWATLSIIVLLSVFGCTHAVKNTYSPIENLPERSTPSIEPIKPEIDLSIPEQTLIVEPAPVEAPVQTIQPQPIYNIDFEDNYKIQHWVQRLSHSNRQYFQQALNRFDQVRPRMEEIFESNGLPTDLVYLCLVESGGNPHAISSAGATGYWQFMPGTARRYGLEINTWIDERRDLEKSTAAAAAYLKHLNTIFDDWLLASAAYNAGEGTINRILRRYPQTETFWDISEKMPIKRETLAYVPKFTATLIMAKNRDQYGLEPPETDESLLQCHDTITVNTFTYLDEIAEVVGVSKRHLEILNPELLRGCTPPMVRQYDLKIPTGTAESISEYLSSIHDPHVEYITHTIQAGDTLSGIAKDYSSTTKGIAQANRMNTTDILTIGKELIVPKIAVFEKPRGKHTYVVSQGDTVNSISKMYGVSVQDIIDVNSIEDPEKIYPDMVLNIPPKVTSTSHARHIQYRVKKGDTLWGISKQFEVSTNDVMRWNQLSTAALIYPGDELTIYHR